MSYREEQKLAVVITGKEVDMLDLDSAIKHCKEKAKELKTRAKPYEEASCTQVNKMYANSCLECAEEHEQLAEWLKELKDLRGDCEYEEGRMLKRMSGGYVTYKVEYLLDNLAREISLLESYRKWKESKVKESDDE